MRPRLPPRPVLWAASSAPRWARRTTPRRVLSPWIVRSAMPAFGANRTTNAVTNAAPSRNRPEYRISVTIGGGAVRFDRRAGFDQLLGAQPAGQTLTAKHPGGWSRSTERVRGEDHCGAVPRRL